MNNIKSIKLSDKFIIETDSSPLKFEYKNEKQRYIIDISHLDILKATRTAILTSTFCFINHIGKKLCWLVKDEEIKRAISVLKLQNVEQIVYTKSPDKKAATV